MENKYNVTGQAIEYRLKLIDHLIFFSGFILGVIMSIIVLLLYGFITTL